MGADLTHSVLEVLLLQVFGINDFSTNHGAVWYLSVLILCSGLLYALLKSKGMKFFIKIIAPFIVTVIPIAFQAIFGTGVVEWNSSLSFIGNPSFYRGLYGMTAGILIYYISVYLRVFVEKVNSNDIIRRMLQMLEILFLALIIIGSLIKMNTLLLIGCIWIMVFLSWNLKHDILLSNTFYDKIFVLTLPIYINHALFVDTRLFTRNSLPLIVQTFLYLAVVVAYSFGTYQIVTKIMTKLNKSHRAPR